METERKFRIGVLTFHRALNYGAVLQSYALQVFLRSHDFESSLLDYFPKSFQRERKIVDSTSLSIFIKSLLKYPLYHKKIRHFDRFLKKCFLSKPLYNFLDLEKINDAYDVFVSGSDQVWNERWNHDDKAYYLDFASLDKKYSYAASLGNADRDDFSKARLVSHLSSFCRLSLREKGAIDMLAPLVDGEILAHVDPTLLLKKEEWSALTSPVKKPPYLLIYTLENDPDLVKMALEIAKERNLKVIQILDIFKSDNHAIEYASCISPEKFVSLFASAEFIVTNSFHGLTFSTIFEKEFLLGLQKRAGAPNDRLLDFVAKFNLSHHLVDQYDGSRKTDYQEISRIIDIERARTLDYFLAIKNDQSHEFAKSSSSCSGCTACVAVCPVDALKMANREAGFSYPIIDDKKCIKCHLCEKVCPYYNQQTKSVNEVIKTLAVKNNDEQQRLISRSGGIFPLLADKVIKEGGAVYGATLRSNTFEVFHQRVEKAEDIKSLCGSKYVESKLGSTFRDVISDLKAGRKVLFSGTPCQNAGLYHLLKVLNINSGNLLSVDIICHGYFSPTVFHDYLSEEMKKHKQISDFDFRDKAFGWDRHIESYSTSEGKVSGTRFTDMFYTNAWLRPSCYECPFAHLKRFGDITLADGWGVKHAVPYFDDNKGVSTILINSEKGLKSFESIADSCAIKDVKINAVMQINMQKPTEKPKQYNELQMANYKEGHRQMSLESTKIIRAQQRKNALKARLVRLLRKLKIR